MRYVIEHLEPKLYKWCLLEYQHISQRVGKENLLFTNIKPDWVSLLEPFGAVEGASVKLLAQLGKLGRVCLLDPDAADRFEVGDAKQFDTLIFGGILGNHPPEARTKVIFPASLGWERRNLGKAQMPTNVAVIVAKKIVEGIPLGDMEFMEPLVIPAGKSEEIILPYRYLKENGNVVLPEGYAEFVKKKGF